MQTNFCFHLVHIRCNGYNDTTATNNRVRKMDPMYEGQPLPETPCSQKLAVIMRQVFL
jgi:hypothetical protein